MTLRVSQSYTTVLLNIVVGVVSRLSKVRAGTIKVLIPKSSSSDMKGSLDNASTPASVFKQ